MSSVNKFSFPQNVEVTRRRMIGYGGSLLVNAILSGCHQEAVGAGTLHHLRHSGKNISDVAQNILDERLGRLYQYLCIDTTLPWSVYAGGKIVTISADGNTYTISLLRAQGTLQGAMWIEGKQFRYRYGENGTFLSQHETTIEEITDRIGYIESKIQIG